MVDLEEPKTREASRSRYSLVVLAAKRARQLKDGAPKLIETNSVNTLTIALEEIAAGKIRSIEVEETPDEEAASLRRKESPKPSYSNILSSSSSSADVLQAFSDDSSLNSDDNDLSDDGDSDLDSVYGESLETNPQADSVEE